ncbi:phosphate regulon sensor histidine kinase PhoR [Ramlibacter sp.]|uniref:phosphate regulon sensor histidine kinase PhoR n=1 Tax=Ramlibacter sp. TaxID=1917967 RepID=UPI00262E3D67|nr:phosphate regulon sensor histidine kinase PhoR [Ramlibacter sp.]MDB5955698.1 putative histidine kinase, classic [Ramlibacter sp.]
MTGRVLLFALALLAGLVAGALLQGERGAVVGIAAGAALWFAIDTFRAARVLRWLRTAQLRGAPIHGGWWGEAADRARRALAAREQQVQDAERRLDAFLDAIRGSPNGVVLLDPQARIEWCNQTAAVHLGLDPERDLKQQIVHLLRDPGFSAFYHGGNYAQDVTVTAPGSAASRPRKLSLHLHPYGEGRRLLLSRDVTAVEQAEGMRRDFVANVSHEIRTPLTVLAGFVETLQTLDLSREERARYLQLMAQQSQRMQTLVSDLLTLSRLEGSPPPGEGEWTPLASLLAQCEQDGRALAASLGKPMRIVIAPAPALALSGNGTEWQSALSNLVSNAVRYTPAGGSVDVQVRPGDAGRYSVAVHDTGPGIAAEHLPRLTERFYRVDRSRSRETGGTGLGLAIVKHVVQRHGGELKIESTPGAGSTFTIVLPAARVRAQSLTPAESAALPATGSTAG